MRHLYFRNKRNPQTKIKSEKTAPPRKSRQLSPRKKCCKKIVENANVKINANVYADLLLRMQNEPDTAVVRIKGRQTHLPNGISLLVWLFGLFCGCFHQIFFFFFLLLRAGLSWVKAATRRYAKHIPPDAHDNVNRSEWNEIERCETIILFHLPHPYGVYLVIVIIITRNLLPYFPFRYLTN